MGCGGRLELPSSDFDAIHYSLSGVGRLQVGPDHAFELRPDQIIVIPRGLAQSLEAQGTGSPRTAQCVKPPAGMQWLRAGEGRPEIILACGLVRATYGQRSGLFDLLNEPVVEAFEPEGPVRAIFEAMLQEFSAPSWAPWRWSAA